MTDKITDTIQKLNGYVGVYPFSPIAQDAIEALEQSQHDKEDAFDVIKEIIKISGANECDEVTGSLLCDHIQYLVDENEQSQHDLKVAREEICNIRIKSENRELELLRTIESAYIDLGVAREELGKYTTSFHERDLDYYELKELTKPFEDEYFKNLSYETIAELAKKSIRLTKENSRIRKLALKQIDTWDKFDEVNEKELERLYAENKELKELLNKSEEQ